MANNIFSETEVTMFWKIATDARRSSSARKARYALEELEGMAMNTANPLLRDRCVAALARGQIAA
ncbi:hypothetical protein [Bradyrhizobium sp. URHD0069]|uniref:hypothetical protein n=1 Tax=Bradyrhizobium sp. URHD0069 TaxID=1380355 RepID=UPI0004969F0E|nr:hypothetical protein [Bradyrhizobium sp. URHD0069]